MIGCARWRLGPAVLTTGSMMERLPGDWMEGADSASRDRGCQALPEGPIQAKWPSVEVTGTVRAERPGLARRAGGAGAHPHRDG